MANDRLYLKSSSGKELCIAKHFGAAWTLRCDDYLINSFFEDDFIDNGRGFYYLTNELYSTPECYASDFIDDYDKLYYMIHNLVLYTEELDKISDIEKRLRYVLKVKSNDEESNA